MTIAGSINQGLVSPVNLNKISAHSKLNHVNFASNQCYIGFQQRKSELFLRGKIQGKNCYRRNGANVVRVSNHKETEHPASVVKDEDKKSLESWKHELKTCLGSADMDEKHLDYVQIGIDRRCVDNIRMLVVDTIQKAKAGHPGLPLGMAEVGYMLYRHVMKYNPENPSWFNRDRFVLSAGHRCLLQYIYLHLAGFESVQIEDLKRLCKLGGRTPAHPENEITAGVEDMNGPLGQGVANAVGFELAEKHLAARFNKPDTVVVDHRTFCIMGDGCAMEGISNEAASLAGHWKLNKLTLIYDDNHNTIDGDTSLAFSEDICH